MFLFKVITHYVMSYSDKIKVSCILRCLLSYPHQRRYKMCSVHNYMKRWVAKGYQLDASVLSLSGTLHLLIQMINNTCLDTVLLDLLISNTIRGYLSFLLRNNKNILKTPITIERDNANRSRKYDYYHHCERPLTAIWNDQKPPLTT